MSNCECTLPLVTMALLAYRQESYVGDAILAAFSQTYSPLEIILSDDASPDGTFEIMRQMAQGYDGPHRIRLNQNPKNLGIAGHLNSLMEMANGELLVIAAGDDISLPNRVAVQAGLWVDQKKRPMSIHSACIPIDSNGNTISRKSPEWMSDRANLYKVLREQPAVEGSTHAWDVKAFRRFGHLRSDVLNEDTAIAFRMNLCGSVEFISEPLIKYRVGIGVSQNYGRQAFHDSFFGETSRHRLAIAKQMRQDLGCVDEKADLIAFADQCVAYRTLVANFGEYSKSKAAISGAWRKGVSLKDILKLYAYYYLPVPSALSIRIRQTLKSLFGW